MKVSELARQAEVSAEEMLEILSDLGIEGKTADDELTDEQKDLALDDLGMLPEEAEETEDTQEAQAETEAPAEAEDVAAEPDEGEQPSGEASEAGPEESSAAAESAPAEEESLKPDQILLTGPIKVRDFAERLGVRPNVLIAELMKMNIFASITQGIDAKVAREIAEKRGFTVIREKPGKKRAEETPAGKPKKTREGREKKKGADVGEALPRPPVVTFLGHVDHGKTSLLDRIRSARVVEGESGGITQHIGAYSVEVEHEGKTHPITFLDTPGHAAFTSMRARGANLTDIAVLVVAADDGVMPQTIEAIQHARAAGVCIVVAINKTDLPGASPDRVRQQLQQHELMPEEWGGEIGCVEVSAATGEGMDQLLERLALESELLELTAHPANPAEGFVIEARLEPGRGPVANLLIKDGTLKSGQGILCGTQAGKVKALFNDQGQAIGEAGPASAVQVLGLNGVPEAGDMFDVYKNEREAQKVADELVEEESAGSGAGEQQKKLSLEDLFGGGEETKELPLVVKADVQGSLEAVCQSLENIKSDKVKIKFILTGVGNVTGNDVMLASASNAIIIGFHVGVESGVRGTAEREGVEVRLYSIIYELLEQVEAAMKGMLEPEQRERALGRAEIRQIFTIGKRARVAGCLVSEGRIPARSRVRVLRGGDVVYEGRIVSLKHYQNDASEIRHGQECGIQLDNPDSFQEGDMIEAFEVERIAPEL
ncbi:translation initiation factor IF-2 [Kiritimatiella glycovorans]|uniref:Translation initiation factor IF-2 n=1 Tax=Kiritimatiella glycovorans TaxID=1307763 RepID=A0A0G3EF10_9BACT|nr:translation initiation factor IF-2 [Kiritimatiella glycovorans]AKJ63350.1 Translation initiation factor IF-2 [Kiritimatiella glycovorans]